MKERGHRQKGKSEQSSSGKLSKKGHKEREVQRRPLLVSETDSDSEIDCKTRKIHMKPRKFDGQGVLADFLSQFEVCRDYNGWSNKEAAFQLYSCCQEDALNRLTTDGVTPKTCKYSDLVDVLEREFGPRECKSSYIMELNQVKQKPGEGARELGNRIKKLASLAFRGKDGGSKATREEMSLNRFILALRRKDVRDVVFGAEFTTLKQAIDKAEYLESYHRRDEESSHEGLEKRREREKHVTFSRKVMGEEGEILSGAESEEMEDRIVKKLLDKFGQSEVIKLHTVTWMCTCERWWNLPVIYGRQWQVIRQVHGLAPPHLKEMEIGHVLLQEGPFCVISVANLDI